MDVVLVCEPPLDVVLVVGVTVGSVGKTGGFCCGSIEGAGGLTIGGIHEYLKNPT